MLARVYKDSALAASEKARASLLRKAIDIYRTAWEAHRGIWSGINAATCLFLLGRRDEAATLARQVQRVAAKELRNRRQDRYWVEATLGEAWLIAGDFDRARGHYAAAAVLAKKRQRYGDLASTRRNVELLAEASEPQLSVDEIVPVQRVAVFTGHRPDESHRPTPRFPAGIESDVAARIRDLLRERQIVVGYASAAAGSDILFLEALVASGAEANVWLPFREEQFIETSIRPAGEKWMRRWLAVKKRLASVTLAADEPLGSSALSYEYTNRLLHGAARLRGKSLRSETIGIAVWDPADPPTTGGATAAVRDWQAHDLPFEIVSVAELRGASASVRDVAPAGASQTDALDKALAAFIFCDAYHFSKLTDAQLPAFVSGFLGRVGELADRAMPMPLLRNTWGDGVFFVFDAAEAAARFALDLVRGMASLDRKALGLPDTLQLRVGVHAGPVYQCVDPITRAPNYFGAHVSRAARIEPITPPGQAFASEPLAALLAAAHVDDIACEYAGAIPLAKGYGSFPMYRLARSAAAER